MSSTNIAAVFVILALLTVTASTVLSEEIPSSNFLKSTDRRATEPSANATSNTTSNQTVGATVPSSSKPSVNAIKQSVPVAKSSNSSQTSPSVVLNTTATASPSIVAISQANATGTPPSEEILPSKQEHAASSFNSSSPSPVSASNATSSSVTAATNATDAVASLGSNTTSSGSAHASTSNSTDATNRTEVALTSASLTVSSVNATDASIAPAVAVAVGRETVVDQASTPSSASSSTNVSETSSRVVQSGPLAVAAPATSTNVTESSNLTSSEASSGHAVDAPETSTKVTKASNVKSLSSDAVVPANVTADSAPNAANLSWAAVAPENTVNSTRTAGTNTTESTGDKTSQPLSSDSADAAAENSTNINATNASASTAPEVEISQHDSILVKNKRAFLSVGNSDGNQPLAYVEMTLRLHNDFKVVEADFKANLAAMLRISDWRIFFRSVVPGLVTFAIKPQRPASIEANCSTAAASFITKMNAGVADRMLGLQIVNCTQPVLVYFDALTAEAMREIPPTPSSDSAPATVIAPTVQAAAQPTENSQPARQASSSSLPSSSSWFGVWALLRVAFVLMGLAAAGSFAAAQFSDSRHLRNATRVLRKLQKQRDARTFFWQLKSWSMEWASSFRDAVVDWAEAVAYRFKIVAYRRHQKADNDLPVSFTATSRRRASEPFFVGPPGYGVIDQSIFAGSPMAQNLSFRRVSEPGLSPTGSPNSQAVFAKANYRRASESGLPRRAFLFPVGDSSGSPEKSNNEVISNTINGATAVTNARPSFFGVSESSSSTWERPTVTIPDNEQNMSFQQGHARHRGVPVSPEA